jgi:hypothetical protein
MQCMNDLHGSVFLMPVVISFNDWYLSFTS